MRSFSVFRYKDILPFAVNTHRKKKHTFLRGFTLMLFVVHFSTLRQQRSIKIHYNIRRSEAPNGGLSILFYLFERLCFRNLGLGLRDTDNSGVRQAKFIMSS